MVEEDFILEKSHENPFYITDPKGGKDTPPEA